MRCRVFFIFALLLTLSIIWSVLPSSVARGGPGVSCSSIVDVDVGPHCWVICPEGDGPPLGAMFPLSSNATITVTVRGFNGEPIPNVPASDFWLIGAFGGLSLCGGHTAINATGPTDANGVTTIASAMSGGGCDIGLYVVVQGVVLADPEGCAAPILVDIPTRSPDVDGDGQVVALDFNHFGNAWVPLGGIFNPCVDFNCDGEINIVDFSVFGTHWKHDCL
jgi:hypothetical protein